MEKYPISEKKLPKTLKNTLKLKKPKNMKNNLKLENFAKNLGKTSKFKKV